MNREGFASRISGKIDSIGYDMVTDEENIIFAGVMLQKSIEILLDKGSSGDVLMLIANYLGELECRKKT
jgi:hypothetical protein